MTQISKVQYFDYHRPTVYMVRRDSNPNFKEGKVYKAVSHCRLRDNGIYYTVFTVIGEDGNAYALTTEEVVEHWEVVEDEAIDFKVKS